MKKVLFILLLCQALSSFNVLKYFKNKGYSAEYHPKRDSYTFSKDTMKVEMQECNNQFSIGPYHLSFMSYPATIKNYLYLPEKDATFLTNVVKKLERRAAAKKDRAIRDDLVSLRSRVAPIKNLKFDVPDKIDVIFIDPGHGGSDPGCSAYGFNEKDLTLQVSKELKKELAKQMPKVKTVLTRTSDIFLTLETRCDIANRALKASENGIFVSVHFNTWFSPETSGFEVYYLQHDDATHEIRLTNENWTPDLTPVNGRHPFQKIFRHITVVQYQREAKMLADNISFSVYNNITNYSVNRGVKSDLFYVLKGTLMPSILIEVGFISNKKDLEFITDKDKLTSLIQAMSEGIKSYVTEYEDSKGFSLRLVQ